MIRLSAPKSVDSPSQAPFSVDLVQEFPVQQVTLKRFDDRIDLPFGAILVLNQFPDGVPATSVKELTARPCVKKFTVLLAHVLFILPTILDSHGLLLN